MITGLSKRLILFLAACAPMIWAQSTGTLSGTIGNPSGAPIANAAVTITNVSTNASQRTLTSQNGTFSISNLPPGTYKIEVESAGYKRTSQQDIVLMVGAPASINITLEPGSMSETVEIKAHAPVVQSDNDQISIGLNMRTVQELPVVDRNHQQLAQLQPGMTVPEVDFPLASDPQRNREWRTNGQPYYSNFQNLEGLSNVEPFRGTAIRVVPEEAVEQFNIISSNPQINQGYEAGAISNVLTRPGTNDWHGSLFEFFNSDILNGRNPFSQMGSQPRLTYNQFGVTAGGHLVRDKVFFFGSYEGNYNRGDATTVASLPTAAMLGGNFSGIPGVTIYNPATGTATGAGRTAFTNNLIPAGSISPFASALSPLIPVPNQPGFANNYVTNLPYSNDWQKFDGRLDAHFTDRTMAFLRYGYTNAHATENSIFGQSLGLGDAGRDNGQNVVLDGTHTFSSNLVGDVRFSYNRLVAREFAMGDQGPLGTALGFTNAPTAFLPNIQVNGLGASLTSNGYPAVAGSGFSAFGSPLNTPQTLVDNNFQWNASGSWHTSRNNLKFGVDVLNMRTDGFSSLYYGQLGTLQFGPGATLLASNNLALGANSAFANSWASFLLGAPTATGITQFATTPTARQTWYSAWVGDTFSPFSRLTIDLGVRWDTFSPITPRHAGGAQIYNPVTNTLLPFNSSTTPNYDLDNLAPRIGLAFRATNKTVIRAGYGLTYFQLPIALTGYMPAMFGSFAGVSNGLGAIRGTTSSLVPGLTPITPPASGAPAPNGPLNIAGYTGGQYETPYVQQFNAQIQQEFIDGIVLGAGYVGNLGRRLPYFYEANQGLPGSGLTGLPFESIGRTAGTSLYTQGLTSNYNSLQVNLTKRMGHGLQFQMAYTYSKALDYTTESGQLLNPYNLHSNYGPTDYDRTHMLTISHVWDLPFGTGTDHMNHGMIGNILGNWSVNGVFTWETGTPFSVFGNPLLYGGPNGTVLANITGPVGYTNQSGLNSAFFNTAAFSAPAPGAFGDQSRNMLRGPSIRNYNFSLFKTFTFMEHYKFEVRGEAYNLTNSPWYANPVANFSSPNFGSVTSLNGGVGTFAGGRQIDGAVRLIF